MFGTFVLFLGIFGLLNDTVSARLPFAPYIVLLSGMGIIIVGSLIYIIGALSKDVYEILYFTEYIANENGGFHKYIGKKMNEFETNQEQLKEKIQGLSYEELMQVIDILQGARKRERTLKIIIFGVVDEGNE